MRHGFLYLQIKFKVAVFDKTYNQINLNVVSVIIVSNLSSNQPVVRCV